MKKNLPVIIIVGVVVVILVVSSLYGGRSPQATVPTNTSTATLILPTNTPLSTSTPDVCSPQNIPNEINRLHAITREFDDTFGLAQNLQLEAAIPLVQDMQRIKRSAEDLIVPACLSKLKEYQLLYMNSGIQVFTVVYSYTSANQYIDQNTLNSLTTPLFEQVLGAAKLYLDEQARLMGWTPYPIPTLEGSVTVTPTP